MAQTFDEFKAALAEDLKTTQKELRVDLNQMPDSYYEKMGEEIERRPNIGVSHRHRPPSGPLD